MQLCSKPVVRASYTQEKVGSLPGAASGGYDLMYRLTLHVTTHSAQVRSRPQCFRRECRRVMHGAHAVVLTHEQSITVQRTWLSTAPANHTDRHSFVLRRRQQEQNAHGTAPNHTVQFSNAFSPCICHFLRVIRAPSGNSFSHGCLL